MRSLTPVLQPAAESKQNQVGQPTAWRWLKGAQKQKEKSLFPVGRMQILVFLSTLLPISKYEHTFTHKIRGKMLFWKTKHCIQFIFPSYWFPGHFCFWECNGSGTRNSSDCVNCHLQKASHRQQCVTRAGEMGHGKKKIPFQDVPPWHALALFSIYFLSSENKRKLPLSLYVPSPPNIPNCYLSFPLKFWQNKRITRQMKHKISTSQSR